MIMNVRQYVFLIILLLSACCKEPETDTEPEVEKRYKRFLGTYHVTDLQTLEEYVLTISHFSIVNEVGNELDTLVITNFDNKFNLKFIVYNNEVTPNYLQFGFHFGIADYNGNHWALYHSEGVNNEGVQLNTLIGDTIYFGMDKSNIAFYIDEGVPYEACEDCILKAVKQ
jgi:hypothetical protein